MSLRICTYNMGTDQSDYRWSRIHSHLMKNSQAPWPRDAFWKASDIVSETLESDYQASQVETAEHLLNDDVRSHLYCLQEVNNLDRPLIQGLRDRGFLFFHSQGKFLDTVVAVDPNRFEVLPLANLSMQDHINNTDIGLARLKDRETGYEMMAASLHVPSFNFASLKRRLDAKNFEEAKDVPISGDEHCRWVARQLTQDNITQMAFIGADMNAWYGPKVGEPKPGQWKLRFDIFTAVGFEILQPEEKPTNVNPIPFEPEGTHVRFIDAGLFRSQAEVPVDSIWKRIANWIYNLVFPIFSAPRASLRDDLDPLNGFDPETNASDHRPVFFEISYEQRAPLFSRIFFNNQPRTAW